MTAPITMDSVVVGRSARMRAVFEFLRGHEMRLDATPPAAWGERFSARARFTAWATDKPWNP